MDWRNDVAGELPAPNQDEPESLRRNILDELSDHLACATQRERIHEDDEETVRRAILNRFGDPAAIARRLWFDAMKGKLMLQKLTAAFAATAALAAIAVCLVLWSAVNGATTAFELAVEQSRKDRDRADIVNVALLAKLETMSADAKKDRFSSLEWNPLKFKLLLGENGERPAAGYWVSLVGKPYRDGGLDSIEKRADADGIVDLGRVRPGNYQATVSTPWRAKVTIGVRVAPGSEVEQIIRCPETKIVETQVELAVDLPQDIAMRKCRVITVIRGPQQRFGKQAWSLPGTLSLSYYELSATASPRVLDGWDRPRPFDNPSSNYGFLAREFSGSERKALKRGPPYAWRTGEYRIEFVALLFPGAIQKSSSRIQYLSNQMFVVDSISYGDRQSDGSLHDERHPTLTPQAGRKNVWKITLPPKMLANARERLKRYDDRDMPQNPKPDEEKKPS